MAQAQSLASVGGPRELPPSSFAGQQYVDSRGCVFLKAGYGGQVNWVPRVNAQRKALCGFPPTFAKVQIEIADEAPAPAPAVVAAAPVPVAPAPQPRTAAIDPATYTPAPYVPPGATTRAAPAPTVRVTAPAPYTDRAPTGTYEVASSGPGPGKIGCYTSAPVAEVVRLRNGGTAVVCTRGDGGVSGWRSPVYPHGSPPGIALNDPVAHVPVARAAQDPTRVASRAATVTYAAAATAPKPPKGYRLAWSDDRLNPLRGQGTTEGMAAQDQIWTRDVPARLVAQEPRRRVQVTVSSKSAPSQSAPSQSAPRPSAATRGALVQVGTFGVPANADGAAARLSALGLPVARGRTAKAGQTLQIVFAGPFASGAEAQAALSAARRAGFADAFLR
jgi:hypothetical protein